MSTIKQRFVALIGGLVLGLVPLSGLSASADSSTPPTAVPDVVSTWPAQKFVVSPLANDTDSENRTLILKNWVIVQGSADVTGDDNNLNIWLNNISVKKLVISYVISNGSADASSTITVNVNPAAKPKVRKVKSVACKIKVQNRNTVPMIFKWHYLNAPALKINGRLVVPPGTTKRFCVKYKDFDWYSALKVDKYRAWIFHGSVYGVHLKKR